MIPNLPVIIGKHPYIKTESQKKRIEDFFLSNYESGDEGRVIIFDDHEGQMIIIDVQQQIHYIINQSINHTSTPQSQLADINHMNAI